MKHYLVDTNIIIDMLLDREYADAACAVIQGAEREEYALYLCALSFTNIYYSLRKLLSHEQRCEALKQLRTVLRVVPVNDNVIDNALLSEWKDFEDAVQYFTGLSEPQITGIITRNTKDFEKSQLEIIDSKRFLPA